MDKVKRSQIQNFMIYSCDVIGITIGYFLMTYLRFRMGVGYDWIHNHLIYNRWLMALLMLTLVYLLFYPNQDFFKRNFFKELIANLKTNLLVGTFMLSAAYLIKDADAYSRFISIGTMGFCFVWMQLSHCAYRDYVLRNRKHTKSTRKMLMVTTKAEAEKVVCDVLREKTWDLWVNGIVILDENMVGESVCGIPVVADGSSMYQYATRAVVDEVFLHIPGQERFSVKSMIQKFEAMGAKINLSIRLVEMDHEIPKKLDRVGSFHTVTFAEREIPLWMMIGKRMLDIIGSLSGLTLTALITVFLAPIIKLESPGPVFFSQERIGKNGRPFRIYKFRSMFVDAEERKQELMKQNEMQGFMFKMENDPRITNVGKFIRKTSIDELPQFWNILKGDMSLVGTRPPTVDEFEKYDGYHKKRLSMTPGLTGAWQAYGRSQMTDFEEIVELDVDYIENWSLKKDIFILFKTVIVVLSGESGAK